MCYVNNNLSKCFSLYGGPELPAGADMHTYITTGNYACSTTANASKLVNCPMTKAFYLKITTTANRDGKFYIIQEYVAYDGRTKINVGYDPYNNVWGKPTEFATKDDLPNIYGVQFEKNNEYSNHVQTIKNIWNKFPDNKPFVCTLVDSNKFVAVGYIYENRKYGAVLYLAFNSCGIVKCDGGTFSDTKL